MVRRRLVRNTLVNPSPFTRLVTLATLVVPNKSDTLASPSRPPSTFTRGGATPGTPTPLFVGRYTRAASKERCPTSSSKYTDLIDPRSNLQLKMSTESSSSSSNGLFLFDFDGGEYSGKLLLFTLLQGKCINHCGIFPAARRKWFVIAVMRQVHLFLRSVSPAATDNLWRFFSCA